MATKAELKKRYTEVQKVLDKYIKNPDTALNYSNPFELLIATILSAQCTDVLVNKVTAKLFKKYKKPADYAKAPLAQLQKDIYPVTFYKNKAVSVKKTAEIIDKKYKGKVPKSIEEIVELPGAARKTANVVLGHAYRIPSGIVVDTHVMRLANRFGLTTNKDPKKIEQDLMQIVPQDRWITFADQMILYGREYCTAKKDKCGEMNIKLKHYVK